MENRGIDPRTSRMLSERSTIWASSPGTQWTIQIIFTLTRRPDMYWNLLSVIAFYTNYAKHHKCLYIYEKLRNYTDFVKELSEVGFEPTPTSVDQNTPITERGFTLESGALDRSAILTWQTFTWEDLWILVVTVVCSSKKKGGEPGHRSPYLSHAKRALYHLS